jgi:hypothetical protein
MGLNRGETQTRSPKSEKPVARQQHSQNMWLEDCALTHRALELWQTMVHNQARAES